MVSDANLSVNLIENSLNLMNCFFLLLSGALFVFQLFDDNVSQCGSLCLSFWELIELLGHVALCRLSNFGSFQPLFFSNILSAPFHLSSFWDSHVYVGILGGVIGLLGSFHFLISSFFFLLRLDNFK